MQPRDDHSSPLGNNEAIRIPAYKLDLQDSHSFPFRDAGASSWHRMRYADVASFGVVERCSVAARSTSRHDYAQRFVMQRRRKEKHGAATAAGELF